MITCSKCFRLNNADARYCDWCGAQPEKALAPIQCTKCRSENDPYAKFCTTCGCVVEPPLRVIDARLRNDLNISASSIVAGVRWAGESWKPNVIACLSLDISPSFDESHVVECQCNIQQLSPTVSDYEEWNCHANARNLLSKCQRNRYLTCPE